MMGLAKYGEERRDYAAAARYMQLDSRQRADPVQLGKELLALHTKFEGNIELLSNEPSSWVEAGLPSDHVRAGVYKVGSTTVDVILVRVDDPQSGKIWLLSKETVAKIPGLYAQMEAEKPALKDRITAWTLGGVQLLGMSFRQWLGWLLSILVSWLVVWLLALLLSMPRRIWCRLRKVPCITIWDTPLGLPLRCIIAILLHTFFVYLLQPPLRYRVFYVRFIAALLVASVAWLVSNITDQGFKHAVKRTQAHRRGGESILIVVQRLTRVAMFIVAFVAALALFGLNVGTALAGFGIGGLAIAFAAQKTLENLLGGVSLLMDKALHIGNFCKIGNQFGTVEDIGLRSIKLRTLDQSLLVVPNGLLSQMQFENFGPRKKCLLNQHFSLRIETEAEQLRLVLDRVQSMLDQQPMIETGTSRIRVANFAGASFDLELWAYVKTNNWAEFTAIRQDVILKIAEIVEAAGTRLAAPTQLTYLSGDAVIDAGKENATVRHVIELRADNSFRFPGESRTGTE
ncbi:mechanosensitive ion channel family protein [Edaphobacter modestus]|nr:mechanosensitive ion channel family protein [Edaphobacter modestus]